MMDIEEKYDLMKRDLDKAIKEADKLDEICYRLERENSDYHFENMKLEKQLAIAKDFIFRCANDISGDWYINSAKCVLKQIEELDK